MLAFAVVIVAAIITYMLQRHRRLPKTTAELRHTESLQERLLEAAHGDLDEAHGEEAHDQGVGIEMRRLSWSRQEAVK